VHIFRLSGAAGQRFKVPLPSFGGKNWAFREKITSGTANGGST
jgi:hypothetical protein